MLKGYVPLYAGEMSYHYFHVFTNYDMIVICSALAQTLMNIMVKGIQKEHNYSGVQSFMGMTIVCTVLAYTLVVFQVNDDQKLSSTATLKNVMDDFQNGETWPLYLTLLASLAYFIEYALNFVFSGFVSNVSFSVSDIARRICIICIGAAMFNKTLTRLNWIGIVIAISGVLWYTYLNDQETKQKAAAMKAKKSE